VCLACLSSTSWSSSASVRSKPSVILQAFERPTSRSPRFTNPITLDAGRLLREAFLS